MAEFLCNQLYQHLILMDGTAIYAPIKCTYLPTKTLPSGKAVRLHTRLNALGLEPFSTVIKDHSTPIFYDSLNHDGSLRVYQHLRGISQICLYQDLPQRHHKISYAGNAEGTDRLLRGTHFQQHSRRLRHLHHRRKR